MHFAKPHWHVVTTLKLIIVQIWEFCSNSKNDQNALGIINSQSHWFDTHLGLVFMPTMPRWPSDPKFPRISRSREEKPWEKSIGAILSFCDRPTRTFLVESNPALCEEFSCKCRKSYLKTLHHLGDLTQYLTRVTPMTPNPLLMLESIRSLVD